MPIKDYLSSNRAQAAFEQWVQENFKQSAKTYGEVDKISTELQAEVKLAKEAEELR